MGSKVHIHKNPYANWAPSSDRELFEKHNPYGMTVSQQRHQFHKQIAEGRTLEEAINAYNFLNSRNRGVGAVTPYQYLLNDTGEDIPGLRTYESLGQETRPLADQFGGVHDLEKIKSTLSSLYPDNPLYFDEATTAALAEEEAAAAEAASQPNYLTLDDLSAWWEGIDKSGWGGKKEDAKPKGMSDFMKFMMFMSVLNPRQSNNINQLGSMFGQFNQ